MILSAARSRAVVALTSALVAGVALGGCGGSDSSGSADRKIAAAFYPLAWVAERVAGEHAEVVNLTTPGQEPHDLELGPRQVADVADAALVLHESGLQPAVDATVRENADGVVVDVADVVRLRPVADHSAEGHAEEETAHADEHADEHDHGDLDPHFWHDPLLMADLAQAVARELGEIDPEHAADFTAAAVELRGELTALDEEFRSGLASCERDLVVVNHDAFGYLARYGLHLEPIAGLSPDSEPTAAQLGRLHDLIRAEGITTVFAETLVSKKTSQTLAGDLGIRADVLDPIEGLTDETADEDYLSLMRTNLDRIRQANGC